MNSTSSARCWPALIVLLASGIQAEEVSEESNWERTYQVDTSAPALKVRNVWGPVTVTSHDQPTIIVRASESRHARDAQTLERSRELLFLSTDAGANRLELSVDGINRRWEDRISCDDCRLRFDFHITAPRGTTVDVRTVMDGRVRVSDFDGTVSAHNVNGDVRVESARACHKLSTVNGEIDIAFATLPAHQTCRIETINGDLRLALPATANADVEFRLGHGRLSSALEVQPLALPVRVERDDSDRISRYRVLQPAAVRIGTGGPRFFFSSMNGDVHIARTDSP